MKKLYTLLFLSIVLLVSGQTPGAENILYVNTAVTGGTGSGNSWNNAIKELSDALRWARQQNNFTSANPLKIYVAKGTYKPMYNAADGQFTSNGNRNNAFVMVNNVQLYGGFDPTNGIDDLTDTRLFGTNGSILSGDIGTVNVNTDNTHHIVISAGAVGSAGLDGFVITDGYANGGLTAITVNTNTIVAYYGAGMYNASSSPALKHVTITGNTASTSNSYAGGGGMYNASSNPVLTYVTISSNTAFSSSNYSGSYAYGGGMYNFSSSPVLTNVMISGNRAYAYSINAGGGGIYNFSSHPVLTNVTIANNKANGGTLAYSIGGGIVNSGSSPKIYNSIFWGNTKYNSTSSDIATSLTFTLKNSITQGYTTGVAADNNLVNTDPLFTNPAADDFSLQAVSVAINKGNNSFYTDPLIGNGNLGTDKDLAGNPRLFANTIDIGAYENQNHPISPDSSNILYVNTAVAGGAGTGDSWSNAFKELSDALRWARQQNNFTSANPLKIYVAKGTYKPMYNAADGQFTSNGNRNNAFVMVNNVQLYGGFDPTNGIDDLTDTRIFGTGGSILSGDIGIVNVNTDNTHHIVISAGEVGSAGLDGFVITEGYANGTANMMVNAKEVYSTYGSGIHNISSSPAIKNVTVTGNTATTSSYAYGAGVYNASSNPVLTNVTISNNIATSTYSGAAGGGIHNNASNPILTNVTISSNTVSSSSSNSSSLGGGMYNTSSHPVLRNVTISSNTVSSSSSSSFSSGGGMHNHTSNPLLTNVTIRSNTATSSTDAFGGGMSNESSAPVLTNVTIANNKANGNSLTNSFDGGIRNNSSSPKIYNSIIWGNTRFDSTSSDLENSSGTTNSITLKNSITQGYTTGVAADNNLVNTDPLFTNPIAGDFSLQTFSVAINKGNNSFYTDPLIGNGNLGTDKDLAGNLRLFANTIDMGAYENQNPLTPDTNNILYINTAVTGGTGSGNSWNNAIKELSDALRWARQQNNFTSSNPLQIYVAKGTYKPLYNAQNGQFTSNGNRNNAFVMVNNVQLYGGFDPANGVDDLTHTRLFGTNGSVLSGDIGTVNVNTDNTYHVVISSGAVGSAGLDGFVITEGYANGTTNIIVNAAMFYPYNGAGMYNITSSPAIKNVTITGNAAFSSTASGGGMYNQSSSPILTKVIISNNTAAGSSYSYGGGMYNINSNAVLTNVSISSNTATTSSSSSSPNYSSAAGGGIYGQNSNLVLTNVMITDNTASSSSSPAYGGGMYHVVSSPILTNVTIANNKANGYRIVESFGGGFYNYSSTTKIYNSIFWGNTKFNTTSSDIETNSAVTLKNSITQGYTTGVAADNNLVNVNPLFSNAASGDFSILANSPANDMGNNSYYTDPLIGNGNLVSDKDLAGNNRVSVCAIDMGAYEYQDPDQYTRWENAAWSNVTGPTAGLSACINDSYQLSTGFTTKHLKVQLGSLTIQPNSTVKVYGHITQSADNKIVLENDANLIQTDNTASNDAHKIAVKRSTHMRKMDYTYWGSPVGNQKLLNNTAQNDGFSVGTPNSSIYNYNEPDDYLVQTNDQYFVPGRGYAIRGKDSFSDTNLTPETYQFNGTINNGVYTAQVQKSKNTTVESIEYEHGYNLVGNPYPSNIDFEALYNFGTNKNYIKGKVRFLSNGSPQLNQNGSAYTSNGYASLTLMGGAPPTTIQPNLDLIPTQYIKAGQGFIVQVRDASSITTPDPVVSHPLVFDNSIRTDQAGVFYNARGAASSKDRFWVQLISPQQFTNTILLGYAPDATNQFDDDYDADLIDIGDDALYSLTGAQKLHIQGRQGPLVESDTVPLGTKYAQSGNYQIAIGRGEGIFAGSQDIYLKDKLLNKIVNISEAAYHFQAIKGAEEDRFEIVYKPQTSLGTGSSAHKEFIVYKDEIDFVVKSSDILKKIQLYDMSGRLLGEVRGNFNELRISHQSLVNGAYILKIYNGDHMVTKKVIK